MLVFCQVRVVRELGEGREKLRGLMLMKEAWLRLLVVRKLFV